MGRELRGTNMPVGLMLRTQGAQMLLWHVEQEQLGQVGLQEDLGDIGET